MKLQMVDLDGQYKKIQKEGTKKLKKKFPKKSTKKKSKKKSTKKSSKKVQIFLRFQGGFWKFYKSSKENQDFFVISWRLLEILRILR